MNKQVFKDKLKTLKPGQSLDNLGGLPLVWISRDNKIGYRKDLKAGLLKIVEDFISVSILKEDK